MKSPFSLKIEVRAGRVIAILVAIPVAFLCLVLIVGLVIRCLGYEDKTLRIGMSTERVREILGEPDNIATLELSDGKFREDWWYSQIPVSETSDFRQLTFESNRLVSNHSKNHLPR
ncbi:MAG: DUF3862 domain-containing protein [Planctomycetota bacterium]